MPGAAYYNEIDPYAAAWLRNLIAAGHIAPGEVDERDIRDVSPDDLRGFVQCHFFAGIGVWSYALRLAGWDDERPVWTGSCPCQPFSAGGSKKGFVDERHLWPAWFHLIGEQAPGFVFGEQVASKDGLGWLDLVYADMEGAGYTIGAADLCAAGVGAPHIRQRLWFVAHADTQRYQRIQRERSFRLGEERKKEYTQFRFKSCSQIGNYSGWVSCHDGKIRPIEPGTFPLAHGIANRVGRLRAYGNAINAEVAATFIAAALDVLP
jgi:DNA (cytosine-5)-methyltransferase 1